MVCLFPRTIQTDCCNDELCFVALLLFCSYFSLQLFPPSVKKVARKEDDKHNLLYLEESERETASDLGLRLSNGNNWSLCDDCWIVQVVVVIVGLISSSSEPAIQY